MADQNSKGSPGLNDEQFFYAHLAEYLDEVLEGSSEKRFASLAVSPAFAGVLEIFRERRGRLQLELGGITVSQSKLLELQAIGKGAVASASEEAGEIDNLSASFARATLIRGVLFSLAFFILALAGYRLLAPGKKISFDPLETLSYEAMALDEPGSTRLALPSEELAEIRKFLGTSPGLSFTPLVLDGVAPEWHPSGASLIDYDAAKVVVTQYHRRAAERLFLFSFEGKVESLPKSTAVNEGAVSYYPFASDHLNIVIWQFDEQTLGFLAGRAGVRELVTLASKATRP